MADLKLAFGLRDVPSDVTTAWGARWIFPADMVHDRTDLKGPDADALVEWLDKSGALNAAREVARSLARDWELRPADNKRVALYEDGKGVIKANPQGSHGYLYVAAWLKV